MAVRMELSRQYIRSPLGNRSAQSGLQTAVKLLSVKAAEKVMASAEAAITAAVENTPKWSGRATEGWHFSWVARVGYARFPLPADKLSDPVYEGGIDDPDAAALNRSVIESELENLRRHVMYALEDEAGVKFRLVTTEGYAAAWLDETQAQTARNWLRMVNWDFYTFNDIIREARTARSLADMGTSGAWF